MTRSWNLGLIDGQARLPTCVNDRSTLARSAGSRLLRNPSRISRAVILLGAIFIGGCSRTGAPTGPNAPREQPHLRFESMELPFRYDRGETGLAWPPETTGGGVGLLDYDGDGLLDLFFAQGGPLLQRSGVFD